MGGTSSFWRLRFSAPSFLLFLIIFFSFLNEKSRALSFVWAREVVESEFLCSIPALLDKERCFFFRYEMIQ
jgi:hypothetical protein